MKHLLYLLTSSFLLFSCQENSTKYVNWDAYLGGKNTAQYSTLSQINKENVKNLKVAWTYASGDADSIKNRTQIQCNPLVIDGILYGSSPQLKFFALDAATGAEKWVFDPFAGEGYNQFGMGVNRGLSYWTDGTEERLLVTASHFLYCINAKTGKLFEDFGKSGKVNLREGLDRDIDELFIVSNTPGIVYEDKLILGSRVSEAGGPVPGHIRAFNVKTGERDWIFHTIPHPDEFGYETWPENAWKYSGGVNTWAGFSLDEERGIVYAPTGSASFDFYGGDRIGDNLFANCLVALNASTGERIWHFQTVHHDLWDRDLPAPPTLITVEREGKKVDAVAQVTKSALIYLFNRETGEPLFPIEERPVIASDLIGEEASETQPIPVKPAAFSRSRVTEADLTNRTPEANIYAKSIWQDLRKGEYFVPPSEQGSIIFPGLDGGGEWGGGAYDPESGNYIINASEMPWILKMNPYEVKNVDSQIGQGRNLYNAYCQSCHGADLKGGNVYGSVPSLVNVKERLNKKSITTLLGTGKGVMPSFSFMQPEQMEAITAFLLDIESETNTAKKGERAWNYPYVFDSYKRFQDEDGFPAITPPWGTLNAINLNTGELAWKVTLGHHPDLENQDGEPWGCENYGGPVVTAGGLVFIAATMDAKFRVFDKDNGYLLYETDLPAPGFATPATYAIDGKQYVVVACGGGKLDRKSGDQYVAFALN
ncbi:MAG: PQQ-binding-like beta-propeller repeat protein [Bacteroidota bacterium]